MWWWVSCHVPQGKNLCGYIWLTCMMYFVEWWCPQVLDLPAHSKSHFKNSFYFWLVRFDLLLTCDDRLCRSISLPWPSRLSAPSYLTHQRAFSRPCSCCGSTWSWTCLPPLPLRQNLPQTTSLTACQPQNQRPWSTIVCGNSSSDRLSSKVFYRRSLDAPAMSSGNGLSIDSKDSEDGTKEGEVSIYRARYCTFIHIYPHSYANLVNGMS